jgi:hypothetical protein
MSRALEEFRCCSSIETPSVVWRMTEFFSCKTSNRVEVISGLNTQVDIFTLFLKVGKSLGKLSMQKCMLSV